VGADLTSAWKVGNARRGLEPIRGPRKRKIGDHLVRGGLRLGVVCDGRDVRSRGGDG
jgi:hypothetical protein